ncbi:MAG: divalent metal cation transporter [Cryomorphaceae bacterium]|nr:divalent metal cation transporter [Cryomorphaceae bacterium]
MVNALRHFFALLKHIGPGLLFAAAAIGVSHLVQSTRAGALYGLFFIPIILITNLLKWPFFEAGPRYAQVTGKSLIYAYTKDNRWGWPLVSIITILSMFIVQATVTMVTAGLFQFLIPIPEWMIIAILLIVSSVLLTTGAYKILDKVIRYIVIVLAISTIAAVLIGLQLPMPKIDVQVFSWTNAVDIAFLVALLGWMPAPLDISIWHSTWTLSANNSKGKKRYNPWDFRVGYWGTTGFAILFLLLGALFLFHGEGEIPTSAVAFSAHLMSVYQSVLGNAYWLVVLAACACMFSTTLTVLDAYPRTCIYLKANQNKAAKEEVLPMRYYKPLVYITAAMAFVITTWFSGQMIALVQLATTIAFLSAPVIAWLNIRAIKQLPLSAQPGQFSRWMSYGGLVFLILFSVYYIYWVWLT